MAGSRGFNDYELLKHTLDTVLKNKEGIEIVSGTARGADKLGERYAHEKGYPVKRFPANWDLHGRSAGPIRNREMAEYADALVAFYDGSSAGTKSMISLAEKNNLFIRIIHYQGGVK